MANLSGFEINIIIYLTYITYLYYIRITIKTNIVMKTAINIANLVEGKKGFFFRYSSEGISRTFDTKEDALEFAKKNGFLFRNLRKK